MLQTIAITVDGIVQGVFYRQSTKVKAVELGIKGEIKNQPDGTVFIIATGIKEKLDQLITWCHKGPERAVVTEVEVNQLPLQSFKNFTILR